jgi:hypothetical protein
MALVTIIPTADGNSAAARATVHGGDGRRAVHDPAHGRSPMTKEPTRIQTNKNRLRAELVRSLEGA